MSVDVVKNSSRKVEKHDEAAQANTALWVIKHSNTLHQTEIHSNSATNISNYTPNGSVQDSIAHNQISSSAKQPLSTGSRPQSTLDFHSVQSYRETDNVSTTNSVNKCMLDSGRYLSDINCSEFELASFFPQHSSSKGKVKVQMYLDSPAMMYDVRLEGINGLPNVIKPEGLDYDRQEYLHTNIREFCRLSTEDLVCPKPHGVLHIDKGLNPQRSRSVDLKPTFDDLSSVASTQTRLRLQLKRVKIFSLRSFKPKHPMLPGSNTPSSDEESRPFASSQTAWNLRPTLPLGLISPVSSFNEGESSLVSSLRPYKPHPGLDTFSRLTTFGDTLGNTMDKQTENTQRSASDNTLFEEQSDKGLSVTSTEEEKVKMARSDHVAKIPTMMKSGSIQKDTQSNVGKVERRRKVKSKTHPPCSSRHDTESTVASATDSNNFRSLPRQEEEKRAKDVSKESLFNSDVEEADNSHLLADFVKSCKPKQIERNRSEPFPKAYEKTQDHPSLASSTSAPTISCSVESFPSVSETSSLLSSNPGELTAISKARLSDRRAIVKEILESERRYVTTLEQISQVIHKLRQSSVLEEELMNTMFHNLRLGELAVHHQILLKQLTELIAGKPASSQNRPSSSVASLVYNTFQSLSLHDNYLAYVTYCEGSKELIKQQLAKNTAFTKLNDRFKLENRSGYDLNHAVSLPANRLLSYKMLLERYQKCTPPDEPDYAQVLSAIDIVNYLLDYVGKVDPNSRRRTLKLLEGILDIELVSADRAFLRVDTVAIRGESGEFKLWMFSDLIVVTINKMHRRSESRKETESLVVYGKHGQDIVPRNKKFYKLYKQVGLADTEMLSSPETELKKYREDMRTIEADLVILKEIQGRACQLSPAHEPLTSQVTNVIHQCEHNLYSLRQHTEDTDLASLRLLLPSGQGGKEFRFIFKDERLRSVWEVDLMQAKQTLETAIVNKKPPEFAERIPVKTRAGMQFSCAAPSMAPSMVPSMAFSPENEVWLCNSDSTIGHLCRMSVSSKPSLIDSIAIPGCSSRVACMCATPPHTETVMNIYNSATLHSTTLDMRHPLMWLGCDDGVIYIIATSRGLVPFRDNYLTLQCHQPVVSMVYMDGQVFVALSQHKIQIYCRDHEGFWDTDKPHTVTLTTQGGLCHLLPVSYKLWCASGNEVTILDSQQPERTFKVSGEKDNHEAIQAMAYCRQGIVAIAFKSSCDIKFFHHSTLKNLGDINVFSAVAQKLSKCDEIITQHKTACLKITSLTCCKHILWVGTTAGVLLTVRLPNIISGSASQLVLDPSSLTVTALDIGHTGNVRFLTSAELLSEEPSFQGERRHSVTRHSLVSKMLVVSGGDGYEVIDPSKVPRETIGSIGYDDSIIHLLVWKI